MPSRVEEFEIEDGRVVSQGKFEGENEYVIHFWNLYLEGAADHDDGQVLTFRVTRQDRQMYPRLKGRRTVRIIQDTHGFVREIA